MWIGELGAMGWVLISVALIALWGLVIAGIVALFGTVAVQMHYTAATDTRRPKGWLAGGRVGGEDV